MAKRIPLDNVCVKKIPTLSSQYDGLIDYVDISSVDNTEKRIVSMQCVSAKEAPSRAKQLLKAGDILVSTVRPNLNAVAMVEQKTDNLMVGSTGYCVLRCNDSIDKRYVFHFCQSPYFVDDMTSQATGASYPAVSSGIVKSATIPDHPIETQKQIADRMDKVSELIALRKKQLAKLDQLVKSRFIELFGDIQKEDKLINLCNFIDYRGKTPEKAERGLPFITAKNVKMHYMSFDTQEFISKETYDKVMTRGFPQIGDVVFTTEAPLGNVCRIPYIETEFYIGQRIITMQTELLEPAYLEYALSSDDFKRKIAEKSSGSTVTGIRSKLLEQLTVPVPPRADQKKFAAFVEQTDKSKLAIQQSLDKLELLKKSLMQEYFG